MSPPMFRRIALGLAAPTALALGLAACGASDVSRADLQEQLEDGDLSAEQASCVTDRLFVDLEQAQINDLSEAADQEELADEIDEAFAAALEECPDAG